jgi:hypothetical protein
MILVAIIAGGLTLGFAAQLKAAHSDRGCQRCHVPHKSGDASDTAAHGVPLWSTIYNADGLPTFTLYSSPTDSLDAADLGQPDGASKLCLGCHDGSYSFFATHPDSTAKFGTGDLETSHPISFTYDSALAAADGELKDPSTEQSGFGGTIAEDLLDDQSKVQCVSCHDPHVGAPGIAYLRVDVGEEGASDQVLCRTCHVK